jgi:tetratricopeptide (TPR) repeat protein
VVRCSVLAKLALRASPSTSLMQNYAISWLVDVSTGRHMANWFWPAAGRSKIIDEYGKEKAEWVPDIMGRAYGNRGNARSRQGKLDAALRDYQSALDLCPWSVDPLLNRGAVLEQLGRHVAMVITQCRCMPLSCSACELALPAFTTVLALRRQLTEAGL